MNNNFIKKFKLFFNQLSPARQEQFSNYISKRSQKHKFHIVSPSPWPFLTSISTFLFVAGIVMYMHNIPSGGVTLLVGTVSVIISMALWFQDIIREATFMGYHTLKVQLGLRLGFLLFIVSEIMFFFAFFWAYFHVSVCPSIFVGGVWPPDGIVSYIISGENLLSPYYTYDVNFNEEIYQITNSDFIQSPSLFKNDLYTNYNDGKDLNIHILPSPDDESAKALTPYLTLVGYFPTDFDNKNFTDGLEKSLLSLFSPSTDASKNNFFKFNGQLNLSITDTGLLINPLSIPLLNTIILLSSGAILTLSHTYLRLERYYFAIVALIITIIFGLAFFGFQIFEYTYAGFSINDGIYGTVFYMLTGFHGFHVFIGTIFLIVCLIRFFYQHFTPANHFGFEAAIWYWHFVDVVWIFLFFFVYLWPNYSFFYPSNEFSYWVGDWYYHASINLSTSSLENQSIEDLLPPYLETSSIDIGRKKQLIAVACNYIEEKYCGGKNLNSFLTSKIENFSRTQGVSSLGSIWDYLSNIWIINYGWPTTPESIDTFETPFCKWETEYHDYDAHILDFYGEENLPLLYMTMNGIDHLPALRDLGYMGRATGSEHLIDLTSNTKLYLDWNLTEDENKKFIPDAYEKINYSEAYVFNSKYLDY